MTLLDASQSSPGEPIERFAIGEFRGVSILWSWSPDARWLLCGPEQIRGGLFLYSLEARSLRKLDESEEAAGWLPDSRRILFNKRGALILLDIVTGRRKELLPPGTLPVEGSWTTFSITRDGRSIAYLEARREGDIWLADFGAASGSQP